jgi:hypothetical protein
MCFGLLLIMGRELIQILPLAFLIGLIPAFIASNKGKVIRQLILEHLRKTNNNC